MYYYVYTHVCASESMTLPFTAIYMNSIIGFTHIKKKFPDEPKNKKEEYLACA